MIFVTATDTDVGKTFFSKTLIKHLIANGIYKKEEIAYFKPVQCGSPTDFDEIKKETDLQVFTSYNLSYPASPDYAASLEATEINISKILSDFEGLKSRYKYIVVEGAGGPAVPVNKTQLVSDLIKVLNLETVLVIRPDLGTINHSLLAYEHLENKGISIKGLYVSAKTREISEAYDLALEEKQKQNSAAIASILKFTGSRTLNLNDFR